MPGRVGVATFDDLECFRFMRSPITAIAQPLHKMGLAALDAVIARCEGLATGAGIETILPTKLVVRESCGAARAGR